VAPATWKRSDPLPSNHVDRRNTLRDGQRLARPNTSKCAWRDGSPKSRRPGVDPAAAVLWLQCCMLRQQLSQKFASTDLLERARAARTQLQPTSALESMQTLPPQTVLFAIRAALLPSSSQRITAVVAHAPTRSVAEHTRGRCYIHFKPTAADTTTTTSSAATPTIPPTLVHRPLCARRGALGHARASSSRTPA
jgi:hypothetical protein